MEQQLKRSNGIKMGEFFKQNEGSNSSSNSNTNVTNVHVVQTKHDDNNNGSNSTRGSHKKVAFFVTPQKKDDNVVNNLTPTPTPNPTPIPNKPQSSKKISDFLTQSKNSKVIPIPKPTHSHTHSIHNSKSTPKTTTKPSQQPLPTLLDQITMTSPTYEKDRTAAFILSETQHYLGKLVLLDYVIYFFPNEDGFKNITFTKEYFMIPLYSIASVEEKYDYSRVIIKTKDRRVLTFDIGYPDFYNLLMSTAFPMNITNYHNPALMYYSQSHKEYKVDGWSCYDITLECQRMELPSYYRISAFNEEFTLCSTYPKYLIVPKKMDDSYLKQLTEYRSKSRFPVLTYYYRYSKTSLLRCSQCISSGKARGLSLEKQYFDMICNNDDSAHKSFVIYDARPLLNAKANAFKGGCLEKESDYTQCDSIVYCDIENIHAVRKAYKAIMRVVRETTEDDEKHFYTNIEQSLWLQHISSILTASYNAAETLTHGRNIVIHCSDGWDRTSQMCALVQVMVDYYYRTIEGFCVLCEKEFVRFGHMFMKRNINCVNNDNEFSPIFIQFLDCVYQLIEQFPSAFEFTQDLLVFISNEVYSCKYGTFLFNCEREIEHYEAKSKMVSIWSEVLLRKRNWYNPMYIIRKKPLQPECGLCWMKVWRGLFFKYVQKEIDKESNLSRNKHYMYVKEMIQVLKENNLFDKLTKDTRSCITEAFG